MYRLIAILVLGATFAHKSNNDINSKDSLLARGSRTNVTENSIGQNVYGTDRNKGGPVQNTDGTGHNKAGPGQNTDGTGHNKAGPVRNTGGTGHNKTGPGQNTDGTGHNKAGPVRNTGGTGHNKAGPGQNTGGIGQYTDGPTQSNGDTGQDTGSNINGAGSNVVPPSEVTEMSSQEISDNFVIDIPHWLLSNTPHGSNDTGNSDQNADGIHQNTKGPAQNRNDLSQNTDNSAQNTSIGLTTQGPAHYTSNMDQNINGPAKTANSMGQNTDGPAKTTDILGQTTEGQAQNTSSMNQNTVGPVQNGGDDNNGNVLAPSTNAPSNESKSATTNNDTTRQTCTTNNDKMGACGPHYNDTSDTDTPTRQGCGYRNPEGVGSGVYIASSHESKFGEFPWMVAILKLIHLNTSPEDENLNVYVGGGSLIHPSIVLTAAHKVVSEKKLRVRAGEWDVQSKTVTYPYQDRHVVRVESHKDFNAGNLIYDVALLFLSAPIDPAPNVGVVCLPPSREKVQGGTRCVASGWGKEKFGEEGRYQSVLKKVEVSVVERASCQETLRGTRLGRFFELHQTFMCAVGEQGKDTCTGDGGSPLVCPIKSEQDRYMQSGIVAWGLGCGAEGVPGINVDVGRLRTWIDDQVKGQGYETDGYSYRV